MVTTSPPQNRYSPVRCAITTQSSPTPTPFTDGVPTLLDTSFTAQSDGSFTPSSWVTPKECSFTMYRRSRILKQVLTLWPSFRLYWIRPVTPSKLSWPCVANCPKLARTLELLNCTSRALLGAWSG